MPKKKLLDHLRMRTTLLVPLLFVSFGWTVISLLILRVIVEQQTRAGLSSDLRNSVTTYENLQRQRRESLLHESALLADLPTLKALMTSGDKRTIQDAGTEFWQTSGSDLFALISPDKQLMAAYRKGSPLHAEALEHFVQSQHEESQNLFYLTLDGDLYEVASQPLVFGDRSTGSPLGYVLVGYALDQRVARQVSQAALAEVAFADDSALLAGTLTPELQRRLQATVHDLGNDPNGRMLKLGSQRYLATAVPLSPDTSLGNTHPRLVVLKSFDQGMTLLRRFNRWVATLGLLALCAGAMILMSISRSITHPLAALVKGARAVGEGDYSVRLSDQGAEEVRELSRAFEHMRVELQDSQKELLQSERLATIGRMARSISHDLRHYLSAMYANAEFMTEPDIPQSEREELLGEVRSAVHGMTELLDSLLLFSQTGRTLHTEIETLALVLQRALSMLRGHPAARDVTISVHGLSSLMAYVDGKKLARAIYNLLLNGCEAAHSGSVPPAVTLTLSEDAGSIRIQVADTGSGVSETVQRTMFLPFVSEGKQSGVGLGLTLAQQVASEHGGYIHYGRTEDNQTLFTIVLPKAALAPPPSHVHAPDHQEPVL